MYRNKKKQRNSLKLALVFILLVIFFALISFVFRALLAIKDSKFDGSHTFNVEIIDKNKTSIISFSPKNKTISILDLDALLQKENFEKSFEIPIDAKIKLSNAIFENQKITSTLFNSAFSFNNTFEGLTMLDSLRLSLFSKSVPKSSIYKRLLLNNYTDSQKATLISLTFNDPTIFSENKSIEIINTTNVYGLGARLANLITNMGGNVIFVTTSDRANNSQINYYGDRGYTVKRLSEYLHIPYKQVKVRGIADVIIIIGKDSLGAIRY